MRAQRWIALSCGTRHLPRRWNESRRRHRIWLRALRMLAHGAAVDVIANSPIAYERMSAPRECLFWGHADDIPRDRLVHHLARIYRAPDVRIHDRRHSYASGGLLVSEGLPFIGKLPTHNIVHRTPRYAHFASDIPNPATNRAASRIAEVTSRNV